MGNAIAAVEDEPEAREDARRSNAAARPDRIDRIGDDPAG
jgi:hypothetical protein